MAPHFFEIGYGDYRRLVREQLAKERPAHIAHQAIMLTFDVDPLVGALWQKQFLDEYSTHEQIHAD